jgi:hypothetical protein
MIGYKLIPVTGLALVLGMVAGPASAVSVTLVGDTVSFTFDDALLGLFGTPSVVGDSLNFTPSDFKAISSDDGIVITAETFNASVEVTANAGYEITGAALVEVGDYFNINSDFTAGEGVAVGGQLIVRDLDDLTDSATSSIVADAPLTALTTLAGFSTTGWSADAGVGIPAAWGGSDGLVSGVNLTVENILLAASFEPSSISFIEKKFVSVAIVTTPVPEPETYAMLLASLGLVGFMARRRRVVYA